MSFSKGLTGEKAMKNSLRRRRSLIVALVILTTSTGSVLALDSGKILWQVTNFGEADFFYQPSDIAVDAKLSRIYIADAGNHRVLAFGLDGKFLQVIGRQGQGPGEFARPTGLCIFGDSELAVADSDSHRIQIFDKDGGLKKVINTKELRVADLVVIDNKFYTISSFGVSGYSIVMGSEEASQPLVTVLDSEGNRVQEFATADFPESQPFVRAIKHRVSLALSPDLKLYLPYFAMNIIQVYDLQGNKTAEFARSLPFDPVTPKLEQQRSRKVEGTTQVQMVATVDSVSQAAHFGPDGQLYILTFTASLQESLKKAKDFSSLTALPMRIDVIDPSSRKLVRTLDCPPGGRAMAVLGPGRIVYIHEDDKGEIVLKCLQY
jgi:hypothetical protein